MISKRPHAWYLAAATGALLLCSGFSLPASAGQECVVSPAWRKIASSHYVQEFELLCNDERAEKRDEMGVRLLERLEQAREVLTLYRELCRELGARDREKLEIDESNGAAAAANPNPVIWKTPTLLTNETE